MRFCGVKGICVRTIRVFSVYFASVRYGESHAGQLATGELRQTRGRNAS